MKLTAGATMRQTLKQQRCNRWRTLVFFSAHLSKTGSEFGSGQFHYWYQDVIPGHSTGCTGSCSRMAHQHGPYSLPCLPAQAPEDEGDSRKQAVRRAALTLWPETDFVEWPECLMSSGWPRPYCLGVWTASSSYQYEEVKLFLHMWIILFNYLEP